MRKKNDLFIVCLILLVLAINLNISQAQKHDNKWMMGYQYAPWLLDPALDFMFGQADTIGYYGYFPMFGTCASICNPQGLLQFYTNGVFIANKFDAPLFNSNNFNQDQLTSGATSLNIEQCALILPQPGSTSEYLIFHIGGEIVNNDWSPLELRLSKIDMNLQGGAGEMTVKKQIVIADTLTYRTLNAVKHGNGRDWWVVIGEKNSRKFYSLLISPNGIDTIIKSGNVVSISNGLIRGQSNFSPDGSLFAYSSSDLGQPIATNKVIIYDFDRCNGTFTFKDSIIYPSIIDSSVFGCAFSPNSRYLYIDTFYELHQYDLLATTISTSKKHIATYDGFLDPFQNLFYRMQLAPDNKIYMVCWGGSRFLHVINDPDQPDSLCDFVQHQLQLSNYHGSAIPTFPYYKLGASIGSGCDTLLTQGLNPISFSPEEITCYYVNNGLQLQFQETLKANLNYSIYSTNGQLIISGRIETGVGPNYTINDIRLSSEGLFIIKLWNDDVQFFKKFVATRNQ